MPSGWKDHAHHERDHGHNHNGAIDHHQVHGAKAESGLGDHDQQTRLNGARSQSKKIDQSGEASPPAQDLLHGGSGPSGEGSGFPEDTDWNSQ